MRAIRIAICVAVASIAFNETALQDARGQKAKRELPVILPRIESDQRQVKVPFDVVTHDKVQSIRLFALWTTDFDLKRYMGGEKWNLVAVVDPTAKSFTFKSPGNGVFWIGAQVDRENGAREPADVNELTPILSVFVESKK